LAQYADQFYATRPAATTRRAGRGTVTYIGVDTLDGELERALLHRVYEAAGAKPANLPPNFIVDWRDGFWVATNFSSERQTIPAAGSPRILVGGREVGPGQAAVWMEQ
jgi:beta-galactosidase